MRHIAFFVGSLAIGGCASDSSRYNIDYESLSSSLYVENSDGQLVEPLGGKLVDIDDVGIGRRAIRLVPGKHWIRTVCPMGPDGVQWTHGQPTIEQDFRVGQAYVLRCKDGYPVIVPHG